MSKLLFAGALLVLSYCFVFMAISIYDKEHMLVDHGFEQMVDFAELPPLSSDDVEYERNKDSIDRKMIHRDLLSFYDVDEDGRLAVNEDGSLMVDHDLKYWFDFHFLMLTEMPINEVVTLMLSKINQLPYPGRQEARLILDDYLQYRDKVEVLNKESEELLTRSMDADDQMYKLEEMFIYRDKVRQLRRESFSYDVDQTFFADEEEMEDFVMSRSKLNQGQYGKYIDKDKILDDHLYQYINPDQDKYIIRYSDVGK